MLERSRTGRNDRNYLAKQKKDAHWRLKGWQLWLIILVFLGAATWLFG